MRKMSPGQRIIASVKDAIEFADGVENGSRLSSVPDPGLVRKKLNLTQVQFAERFGLPVATICNWEQKRTVPDAPARVLLTVIDRHPEAVIASLIESNEARKTV